ncbi:ribonuclease H-like domain-containing protein [Mycena vitilis]|nr:ribonuclease H-like domain-containing protein [Mycena vitilis]
MSSSNASGSSLPMFPQDFTVHYLTTECSVNRALLSIEDGVVGFDTEYVPRKDTPEEAVINEAIGLVGGNRKSAILGWQVLEKWGCDPFPYAWDTMGLSLVQIARGSDVWVIDVRRMKAVPGELLRVLTSTSIAKVGVGVVNDIPVVWNDLRMDLNNLIDAGLMARLLLVDKYVAGAYQNLSLVVSAQEVLGYTVDKGEQVSDWTAQLTDAQIRYAATDAMVSLRLYERLVPELEVRSVLIGRDIPSAWYRFNSRMGEPTRIIRTCIRWGTLQFVLTSEELLIFLGRAVSAAVRIKSGSALGLGSHPWSVILVFPETRTYSFSTVDIDGLGKNPAEPFVTSHIVNSTISSSLGSSN